MIGCMYFRRTIARPRMAVTHHESVVLYPVGIRVILVGRLFFSPSSSFFLFLSALLCSARIIVNDSGTPISVPGFLLDYSERSNRIAFGIFRSDSRHKIRSKRFQIFNRNANETLQLAGISVGAVL